LLSLILLASLLAPWLSISPPNKVDMAQRLKGPGGAHYLGTDQLGRDVWARVLFGGRVSISLAVAASTFSLCLGLGVGLVAGYFGGPIDNGLLFVTNIFQGLPTLTVMLALSAAMGPGIDSILIAMVLTSWTGASRIIRGEVLNIRRQDFVEGTRCLGAGPVYIMWRHILPNLVGTAVVVLTVRISRSVLAIASLSFLGFGVQPPTPDWGGMVKDALTYYHIQPMLIIAPGMAVFLTSLCINMLGDALRDFFDVRWENASP
jgi:peptide/nickel transport system permease protein